MIEVEAKFEPYPVIDPKGSRVWVSNPSRVEHYQKGGYVVEHKVNWFGTEYTQMVKKW